MAIFMEGEPILLRNHEPLSEREQEVLQALSEGYCNREIAQRLFISQETVKTHISTVIGKLGVRDRTQAAVMALRVGLLSEV